MTLPARVRFDLVQQAKLSTVCDVLMIIFRILFFIGVFVDANCDMFSFNVSKTQVTITKAKHIWEFSLETYRGTLDSNLNKSHQLVVLSRNNTVQSKTVWGHG